MTNREPCTRCGGRGYFTMREGPEPCVPCAGSGQYYMRPADALVAVLNQRDALLAAAEAERDAARAKKSRARLAAEHAERILRLAAHNTTQGGCPNVGAALRIDAANLRRVLDGPALADDRLAAADTLATAAEAFRVAVLTRYVNDGLDSLPAVIDAHAALTDALAAYREARR